MRPSEQFVRNLLQGEGSGHDWYHVDRVRHRALQLAASEGGCDLAVVELAALLHDVCDHKFPQRNSLRATLLDLLARENLRQEQCAHILAIVDGVSYKGAGVATPMKSMEGKVVQDADRLDAMGAIGIARCFAYGGAQGRLIYDPEYAPQRHADFESYRNANGGSLAHFYEKLFLLRDRMQTQSGRKQAESLHAFMEEFVQRFLAEWSGPIG